MATPQEMRLAAKGHLLDLNKGLSYGVQNSAQNLIDERAKAIPLSWEIANRTTDTHYIVISSLFDNAKNQTIFDNVNDMLAKVVPGVSSSYVWAFKDGRLTGTAPNDLFVTSKTPGRYINQFLSSIGQSPTRITSARLKSVTTAGAQDLGNFDAELKTMFMSPFAPAVEMALPLSNLVKTNTNFSPNILDIDFVNEAFPLILSNEHFLILQVNAGTTLTLNVKVGAQDSRAQRMWRTIKKADDIMRGEGM